MLVARGSESEPDAGMVCNGLSDPRLDELLEERQASELREQVEMVRELCPKFDHEAYLAGNLTPVYFGSAQLITLVCGSYCKGCLTLHRLQDHKKLKLSLLNLATKKFLALYLKYRRIWMQSTEIE